MYELRSGPGRHVDLLPYRRFFAALVLQQVLQRVALKGGRSITVAVRNARGDVMVTVQYCCGSPLWRKKRPCRARRKRSNCCKNVFRYPTAHGFRQSADIVARY